MLKTTTNGKLVDKAIRHAHSLEKYKQGTVTDIVGFLNSDVLPDVLGQLQTRLDNVASRGFDTSTHNTTRLKQLANATTGLIQGGMDLVHDKLRDELKDFALSEATWQGLALKEAVPLGLDFALPSEATLAAIVEGRPFQGKILKEWFDGIAADTQSKIIQQVNIGIAQGQSVPDIVSRIRGTRELNYADGLVQGTRTQVAATARTAINHTSTHAREATYDENSDVVDKIQIVATLDSRTTEICMGMDGKTFPVNEGPRPPFHFGCRTTTVPITKSWDELGIPGLKEPPAATRASMDGQVPDKVTYGEWLKQQTPEVQNEALGPARAELFRSGAVKIEQFTNDAGKQLTLEQLKEVAGTDKYLNKGGVAGNYDPTVFKNAKPPVVPPEPKLPEPVVPQPPVPKLPTPADNYKQTLKAAKEDAKHYTTQGGSNYYNTTLIDNKTGKVLFTGEVNDPVISHPNIPQETRMTVVKGKYTRGQFGEGVSGVEFGEMADPRIDKFVIATKNSTYTLSKTAATKEFAARDIRNRYSDLYQLLTSDTSKWDKALAGAKDRFGTMNHWINSYLADEYGLEYTSTSKWLDVPDLAHWNPPTFRDVEEVLKEIESVVSVDYSAAEAKFKTKWPPDKAYYGTPDWYEFSKDATAFGQFKIDSIKAAKEKIYDILAKESGGGLDLKVKAADQQMVIGTQRRGRSNIEGKVPSDEMTTKTQQALDWIKRTMSDKLQTATNEVTVFGNTTGRAFEYQKAIYMSPGDSVAVYIHELGHYIEEVNPEALRAAGEFLNRRTAGETPVHMGRGYAADEITKPDKFFDKYIGKLYGYANGPQSGSWTVNASEVLSMGIQAMFTDPVKLLRDDRDMFAYIVNVMRGKLR